MKLKSKSHISNNNKNIVYVINNNPPIRRRQNKRKSTMNDTTQGNPSEANSQIKSENNSIRLPDNRFLNSSYNKFDFYFWWRKSLGVYEI